MKSFFTFNNEQEFNTYLFEGVDINLQTKTVTFTDNHENLVDTSGTLNNKVINGINTYMLFKRSKSNNNLISDGNPLVYALKNIKNWKLSNRQELLERIKQSLQQLPQYDVVIMVPSSNPLMSEISKFITNTTIIDHCLLKKTKEEVLADMDFSVFSKKELVELDNSFGKMGEYFESKYFPKPLLHKLSSSIFKVNIDNNDKLAQQIINKNILIIDDTISSGYSTSSCANVIKSQYFPNTVTQFSLFSDLN